MLCNSLTGHDPILIEYFSDFFFQGFFFVMLNYGHISGCLKERRPTWARIRATGMPGYRTGYSRSRETSDLIPALPSLSYVALVKYLNLSEPQFPYP